MKHIDINNNIHNYQVPKITRKTDIWNALIMDKITDDIKEQIADILISRNPSITGYQVISVYTFVSKQNNTLMVSCMMKDPSCNCHIGVPIDAYELCK